MQVIVITLTEKESERRDYCEAMVIEIDGERVFKVHDGEPEDNNICRNFNDVYNVPEMLKKAYTAGKNGEDLEIINKESEEI